MHRACLLALVVAFTAFADTKLYLKTRVIDTSEPAPTRPRKTRRLLQAETTGRVHLLVQFGHRPGEEDLRMLTDRGANLVGYVHENGFVVSTGDANRLENAGLAWIGKLEAADKISPLLSSGAPESPSQAVVIEVHPDVSAADAHRVALDSGVVLADNPDLTEHHVLASANPQQIAALANRDEVAYIFPASADLASGQPTIACAGALTQQGNAGQYIAKMGDGWGGPGGNAATVAYFFSDVSLIQIPGDSIRAEILRALQEWTKYVKVTFTPGSASDSLKTINILFGQRAHGDAYPFDGRGGVLAHTFYPAPPNPEPLAGDMHFDADEHWQIGNDTDLFSVALHEAGHALGLGHSDRPGAVMYPYYTQTTGLTADDIAAIQSMYAVQDVVPSGPAQAPSPVPADPAPPTSPSPVAPRTVPAAAPAPPAPQPLSLALALPPSTTTAESVILTGYVSGGSGAAVIVWRNGQGQSGVAAGATSWSAQVPLAVGPNSITITASDAQHAPVSRTAAVTRQPASPGQVSIQLAYPATTGILTVADSSLNLHGTASHTSGIQSVRWSTGSGTSGLATGTTSWDAGPVSLQPGVNSITVQATANDGSTGVRTLQVAYASSSRDTTAPALTITSPGSLNLATTSESIVLRGTASDNVGVTAVAWFSSTGASGDANGTLNWATPEIPLIRGYNSIIVRAFDAAGNVGWRLVGVTRQ